MISGIQQSTSADSGSTAVPTSPAGTGEVTKNMFLQLLVAQIKNQDPLSPTDGVQFLTQLAQFQQLEQSMNMGQDLTAIRGDMDQLVTTPDPTGTTSTTN
jgi:flagellar basal-body rod modification protein FlgD